MTHDHDDPLADRRKLFGRRMRAIRERAGLTVRDVARDAGIDKNTVCRLEAGLPIRESTRLKICEFFGVLPLPLEHHLEERHLGKHFARHRPERERWFRLRTQGGSPTDIIDSDDIQDPHERRRLGQLGFAAQFIKRLGVDRPNGWLRAALVEIHGPGETASQRSGEAFVYSLRGSIRFFVGEESFVVDEGSAATFDRTVPHRHEPIREQADAPPVLILYVQVD